MTADSTSTSEAAPHQHPPTPEQEVILDAARATSTSLSINAYAGCGKTSTLTMVARELEARGAARGPSRGSPQSSLALAFNVRIKKELESRFPSTWTVLTMNGLGHRTWGQHLRTRLTLDERKYGKCITEAANALGTSLKDERWELALMLLRSSMRAGVVPRHLPFRGLVPDTPETWSDLAGELSADDDIATVAREALALSIRMANQGIIDFDDQIYCPTLLGASFPRYALTLVDEAQDLSPLQHRMLAATAADRIIQCGDRMQAIYQFRGADGESMDKLKQLRSDWIDLPLTTTFRCPKVIVERQQSHAPGFNAADSAPDGEFLESPRGTPWGFAAAPPRTMVLCRNNAPLLSLALKLFRQGKGCEILGKDLGKSMVSLTRRLSARDDAPIEVFRTRLDTWAAREIREALSKRQNGKADRIADQQEALIAVSEAPDITTAGELRTRLTQMFAPSPGAPSLLLSTGHRAKGLEASNILHLDPWRLPSRFATSEGEIQQEQNLHYVIETRTQHRLTNVSLEDFS